MEEQSFIKDSSLSVADYVKNNNGEVVAMTRFAVGEGIENSDIKVRYENGVLTVSVPKKEKVCSSNRIMIE